MLSLPDIQKLKMQPPELLFAPFKGLTNKVYRNALARHFGGYDVMYAPFISGVGQERIKPSKLADVIPIEKNLAPTVPQFISTDAREIILFGKTLHQHGYDHINWNLGCPFSRIANKKRGCGMLPYPDELDRILHEVFKEFPIRLSIKTRLGYYRPEEILRVLEVLNRYPIHLLIIHARLGTQIYSGDVNLEGFEACLSATKHPVAYNGDIYHKKRFREMQHRFPGISTWMMGRAVLMNPFLAMEIKGVFLNESEKRERLFAFHYELLEGGRMAAANEARLLGSMKAIWYYLSGIFENGMDVFSEIKKTKSLKDYQIIMEGSWQQPFADDAALEKYFRKGVKHRMV
jgi:tRNA-dihydrouridine synthase B